MWDQIDKGRIYREDGWPDYAWTKWRSCSRIFMNIQKRILLSWPKYTWKLSDMFTDIHGKKKTNIAYVQLDIWPTKQASSLYAQVSTHKISRNNFYSRQPIDPYHFSDERWVFTQKNTSLHINASQSIYVNTHEYPVAKIYWNTCSDK